jgi:hypothetical protein
MPLNIHYSLLNIEESVMCTVYLCVHIFFVDSLPPLYFWTPAILIVIWLQIRLCYYIYNASVTS